ncbi:Uncharacterized protein TCM_016794 [Theobroma cacao]|uniref:Uncharacterized protein n=1 Tax=Theobroma cacao TaxID=3641 RepID=A0A061EBH4_THECC|nr:Uncharacterized protein TCM_016794 [Theobroma cacao]
MVKKISRTVWLELKQVLSNILYAATHLHGHVVHKLKPLPPRPSAPPKISTRQAQTSKLDKTPKSVPTRSLD